VHPTSHLGKFRCAEVGEASSPGQGRREFEEMYGR
jgi:hypothetical protein